MDKDRIKENAKLLAELVDPLKRSARVVETISWAIQQSLKEEAGAGEPLGTAEVPPSETATTTTVNNSAAPEPAPTPAETPESPQSAPEGSVVGHRSSLEVECPRCECGFSIHVLAVAPWEKELRAG